MSIARKLSVILILGLLVVSCAAKKAVVQGGGNSAGGDNTIAGILAKAGTPLSADQAKQLKAFKPDGDRGAFRAVYEIFNEKQLDALKKEYGTSPGFNDGPERPRFLFFAVLFENAGCPLTAEQLTAMKALPNDRGAFQQMRELFTDEQGELLQSMFNR